MNLSANRKGAKTQRSVWFLALGIVSSVGVSYAAPAPPRLPLATENQLRALLRDPVLRAGHVGVAVEALGTAPNAATFPARNYDGGAHPVLFASAADQRYLPASNMKLFTAALALQQLGPEHTFATRLWRATPKAAPAGTPSPPIFPLLVVQGGGDPSLSTDDLNDLAGRVTAEDLQGMGGITADGNALHAEQFDGHFPNGWTLDDSLWYYGASVSALTINRNQFDIAVKGGARPGDPVLVDVALDVPQTVVSHAMTGAVGSSDTINFDLSRNAETGLVTYIVTGTIAPGQTHTDGLAITDPFSWATTLLQTALGQRGLSPLTHLRALDHSIEQDTMNERQLIATHNSPPLRVLLQKFLKTSDNLYGEVLLRDAALYGKSNAPAGTPIKRDAGTAASAHTLLRTWLKSQGINDAPLRFEDGSGLSRYDLLTPHAIVDLLRAVQTLRGGDTYYAALPIAGVDGTLKKRMAGTPAQNNVRAKTGTFSIASCLSGYVTTRDGQRLAVSVMTNFVEDGDAVRRIQDRIFATLAAANFKAK